MTLNDLTEKIVRLERELKDERRSHEHTQQQHEEFKLKATVELSKRAAQIKTLHAALKRHHGCARWNADDAALTEEV